MSNKTIKLTFAFSSLLLLITIFFWWQYVYNTPSRVFDSMLSNSLSLQGVTRVTELENANQSLKQTMQLQVGEQNVVAGKTRLSQQTTTDDETIITTKNIGTPQTDYIKYANIDTGQTGANGEPLDFSSVVGVWGKSSVEDTLLSGGEIFGEAVLGVIPMGSLPQSQRQEILDKINELDLYEYDAAEVTKEQMNGRYIYRYDITMQPQKYVTLLKQYADMIGLTQLSDLNPSDYANSPPLRLEIAVDVLSRQLIELTYTDSGRTERYEAYGLNQDIVIPEETIPIQELQSRLQSVQ